MMVARFGKGRVKRGLLHFFIGKSVSAVAGLLAMLLVVHGLSVDEFAHYSVLVALVEVFTAVSGFGLSHVMLRYVPELYANYRTVALRYLILMAFGFRSLILVSALGLVWWCSPTVSGWIGLEHAIPAFQAFLVVVAFRSTNQFLSLILESMLHQGISQTAFSVIALGRCVGMLALAGRGMVMLTNVIWLEALCECLATCLMVAGIAATLWPSGGSAEDLDDNWQKNKRTEVIKFAMWAYLQHLATLPFGGNTNRLVGGRMFGSMVMASFGFALSLYEYAKRYLPTQLLIGLIRPIVIARYTTTNNFSRAAALCEQALQFNLVLLVPMLAVLLVSGDHVLGLISGGRYMENSAILLCVLLILLVFETQRLVLEVLTQMVNHYEILVPGNLMLSLSVLGGIAGYYVLGALAFPVANLLTLALVNRWTTYRLARLGYGYQHDWNGTFWCALTFVVATVAGKLCNYAGLPWELALAVTLAVNGLFFWKFQLSATLRFARDMVGEKVNKG